MHFTNVRSISRINQQQLVDAAKPQTITMFNMTQRFSNRPVQAPIASAVAVTERPAIVDPANKILWGAPFWFFFHTLAEKVKPEVFYQNRDALLGIIREICSNLPCPTCTTHATQYLNNINFNAIQTKQDFIMMLYEFHNSVNKRKNLPIFPYSELQPKYERANLVNIVNHFMHFYKIEHRIIRLMAEDMYRRQSAKSILDWLHANQHIFNK
jgi:hypothetical protein